MERKTTLLKPKIDIVFHSLFRVGNEEITKAIIEAVTKEKIESINLNTDRHLIGKYPNEKMGILDLKAILNNGTICNIEIQLADNKDTAERFLYYWSKIYLGQLVKGEEYKKINKVIGIIILDYEFERTKEIESISTKWKVKEVQTGKELELTDVLELYILEIPKARKILEKEIDNELAQWMAFLDDPNKEEVSKIMENNQEIKKAMNELEEMSEDEELRSLAELREKAIRDEKNGLRHAREEGIKEGIEEGIKQGIGQGIEQVTKKMIKLNMPVEDIINVTGLKEEEILKIKNKLS